MPFQCVEVIPIAYGITDVYPALGRTDTQNTLYRCNDNKWCCSFGGNTTSCCQDTDDGSNLFQWNQAFAQIENGTNFAKGYTIAPISALQTNAPEKQSTSQSPPSRSAVSTLTAGLSSTATARSVIASSTPSVAVDHSNNHEVAKVGAGVGVGVGVPLLLGLGTFLFLWLRERRINRSLRKDLDACGHSSYPVIPNGRRKNEEYKAGEPGEHHILATPQAGYAEGKHELQGPLDFQQLSAGSYDVNQELPARSMRD